jgi:ABC-type transport system involved in multi-copper enzyme maturation permease subunit
MPGSLDSLNPLQALVFGAQAFASGAAYWVGILLCLFATGGLVAGLVEPGQADLLLSKPLSRSAVLAGRLAGVGVVTLALLTYLLGAVWIVMAVKTGFWNPRFLLAIPAVWAMFAVLYGVVTLASVWSGSGPLALVVTLGLVFTTLVLAIPGLPLAVNATVRPVVSGLGAVLPRFATVGANLVPHLAAGAGLATLTGETDDEAEPDEAETDEADGAQPGPPSLVADTVPLLTSLLFGAVCYAAAFALFHRRDA